jgi:hypothetical protein
VEKSGPGGALYRKAVPEIFDKENRPATFGPAFEIKPPRLQSLGAAR